TAGVLMAESDGNRATPKTSPSKISSCTPTTLSDEMAATEPAAVVALTSHWRALCSSAATGWYSELSAPAIGTPLRSQRYSFHSGLPSHSSSGGWQKRFTLAGSIPTCIPDSSAIKGREVKLVRSTGAGARVSGWGSTTAAGKERNELASPLSFLPVTRHWIALPASSPVAV